MPTPVSLTSSITNGPGAMPACTISRDSASRLTLPVRTVIRPPSRFNRGSLLDGRLYISLPESGINVLEGDTFRALPGTDALAREVYPFVLRYDERRLLIGTRLNGLFLYDGAALTLTERGRFLGGGVTAELLA